MIATIIEIGLVTLVLIGIIKEEKLIAFEDIGVTDGDKLEALLLVAKDEWEKNTKLLGATETE